VTFDFVVECFFYCDLVLNFFHAYRDSDNLQVVSNIKGIAIHYFQTWFIIDFISVFPFGLLFPTGVTTRLLRLARLPRLFKLLDVNRFNKVLKSFD